MAAHGYGNGWIVPLLNCGLCAALRAIESLADYEETGNEGRLADVILSLHPAAEYLLWEILIGEHRAFVFEDARETAARHGSAVLQGADLFALENPPRLVSLIDAVSRIESFVHLPGLGEHVREQLLLLDRVHRLVGNHGLWVPRERVIRLFSGVWDSLQRMLEPSVGDIAARMAPDAVRSAAAFSALAREHAEAEREVRDVARLFHGQRCEARFFGGQRRIVLPVVESGSLDMDPLSLNPPAPGDLWFSGSPPWLVHVSLGRLAAALTRLSRWGRAHEAITWVIVWGSVTTEERLLAEAMGVLLTDREQWRDLALSLQRGKRHRNGSKQRNRQDSALVAGD